MQKICHNERKSWRSFESPYAIKILAYLRLTHSAWSRHAKSSERQSSVDCQWRRCCWRLPVNYQIFGKHIWNFNNGWEYLQEIWFEETICAVRWTQWSKPSKAVIWFAWHAKENYIGPLFLQSGLEIKELASLRVLAGSSCIIQNYSNSQSSDGWAHRFVRHSPNDQIYLAKRALKSLSTTLGARNSCLEHIHQSVIQ